MTYFFSVFFLDLIPFSVDVLCSFFCKYFGFLQNKSRCFKPVNATYLQRVSMCSLLISPGYMVLSKKLLYKLSHFLCGFFSCGRSGSLLITLSQERDQNLVVHTFSRFEVVCNV